MNIINIFELNGMPDDVEGQNKLVDEIFSTTCVHVKEESGKYFLVRINHVDESKIESVKKLDPVNDSDKIKSILDSLSEAMELN